MLPRQKGRRVKRKIFKSFLCGILGLVHISLIAHADVNNAIDYSKGSWERIFDDSVIKAVLPTPDGNYFVAASTLKPGGRVNDIWIFKMDAQGQFLWTHTYGDREFEDWLGNVQETQDGCYLVTGSTESKGAGDKDIWVLKLDAQGEILWDRTYGGSKSDYAKPTLLTPTGDYLISGYTESKGVGERDLWVLKLDAQGELLWDRTYGGSRNDSGTSIELTPDGGYLLAGYTESKGSGEADIWVLKLGAQGELLWDHTYGGNKPDYASSVQLTPDGGYLIAGYTESISTGYWDTWILKLDAQGEVLWNRTYGGEKFDFAKSIQLTPNGGYLIAGDTGSKGAGKMDIWVFELDAQGEFLWDRTYGGSQNDSEGFFQITRDGGYILAGKKNEDGWIIKITGTQLLSEQKQREKFTAIKSAQSAQELYLMGYKYEETDVQIAVAAYQEILERFPNSDLAIKAIDRLDNLPTSHK
jgi:uncharacterized delta-60 repeat protein